MFDAATRTAFHDGILRRDTDMVREHMLSGISLRETSTLAAPEALSSGGAGWRGKRFLHACIIVTRIFDATADFDRRTLISTIGVTGVVTIGASRTTLRGNALDD